MKRNYYNTEETIVALATPLGTSALAIIRLSGPKSIEIGAKVFSNPKALLEANSYTQVYGFIQSARGKKLDEVLISVYRAPTGYTGEAALEISCHGSIPAIEAILLRLREAGAVDALPGEFTFRAFMNGKIELTQAEAVHEVVQAKSSGALSQALNRLTGSLGAIIKELQEEMLSFLAPISLQLDYPEEEMDEPIKIPYEKVARVGERIKSLVDTYRSGVIFHEGAIVALGGRTNAGKSSLFNMILSQERAIVSDIHGTTRDYIEDMVSIGGIPCRLYDTAGIRESQDPIEQEGIRRTNEVLKSAHVILYLVHSVTGADKQDLAFVEEYRDRVIPIWSQFDRAESTPPPKGFLPISTATGEGFSQLEDAIVKALPKETAPEYQDPIIESHRQKELLAKAYAICKKITENHTAQQDEPIEAIAMDGREVVHLLGELCGEVTNEDLFEKMFSQFCMGK